MPAEISKVAPDRKPGRPKGTPRTGGRQKGTPNKITASLKEALLLAGENAGGKDGLVGYLTTQAAENPASFLPLLGRVLPLQVDGTLTHDVSDPLAELLGRIATGGKRLGQ